MRSLHAALIITAILVLAGAGVSMLGTAPADAATVDLPASEPTDHAHTGHGGGAHDWSGGKGTIPTLADALTRLERRQNIVIDGDAAFNPANGVRSGRGTFEDAYIISGWFVDTVLIKDTSAAFVFTDNYVNKILILDWNGKGGYVHHNLLTDFRTNRNVERTGAATAAVIENNLILNIEQLRHFDGEVRNNTIGQANKLPLRGDGVVFDIAGLNGAGIHHNIIYGGVDMKLHGHHHSDKPGLTSHNHGEADEVQQEAHTEDHQVRYVDFLFYANRIVDDTFGMRYNDLNHAGDDRTATSEQEPMLEKPHIHHTSITIRDNIIDGATLRVAAVSSIDERHVKGETATITVENNRILKPTAGDGIVLQDVRNATVVLRGNIVEKSALQLAGTSAVFMQRFWNATILVEKNTFGDYKYGVRASAFDEATTWIVAANTAPGVRQAVYWDDSVANPPGEASADDGHGDHTHSHEKTGGADRTSGSPLVALWRTGASVGQ